MNKKYYDAALAILNAVPYVRQVDVDFIKTLLNKAEEYKSKIKIDEELEKEVIGFKKEIEKGL